MVIRKEIGFDVSTPYHVLTRAIEGKEIFITEEDCYRFIFQMYAANVGRPALNLRRKNIVEAAQMLLVGEDVPEKLIIIEHLPLVHVLSFVLVINHFHFTLLSNNQTAISKYIQKLKTGFAMYFNLKYSHRGNLFEKPYKSVPIKTNFQLDAVLRYINIKNVLDVYQPDWRERGLEDTERAVKFLDEYKFSSFPDLFRQRNSKILPNSSVLMKYLGEGIMENKNQYVNNFIESCIFNKKTTTDLSLLFEE